VLTLTDQIQQAKLSDSRNKHNFQAITIKSTTISFITHSY